MESTGRTFFTLAGAIALAGVLTVGCDGDGGTDCPSPCGESQECCDGVCVFTVADSRNCGACGNVCPSGNCTEGVCGPAVDTGPPPSMCTPECPASQRCCGTRCVERAVPTSTDGRTSGSFENCNGCGIACDPERAISCSIPGGGTEGTPRCMCGDLDQCLPGDVCVMDSGFWTCTSLSTDPNNCGAVGNMCAEGESCSGGMCVCGSTGAPCPSGQACCGGACIDTAVDPLNCGGCGTSCTPNAPDCQGGSCTCAASGRACTEPTAGIFGIGSDPGESCCPSVGCVANSDANCACEACTGDDECVVGGSGLFGMLGGGGDEVTTVCCGDSTQVAITGCEGFGGIFGDGGLGFPIDGAVPGFDAGSGGGTDAGGGGTDAGTATDAGGGGTDAGTAADAGTGTDAGSSMDAGVASDAGMDGGA